MAAYAAQWRMHFAEGFLGTIELYRAEFSIIFFSGTNRWFEGAKW